jgi:hypothetical protein
MSNNLGRIEVSSGQNQKEVTINAADGRHDAALTETLVVVVDDTNAATVTTADMQQNVLLQLDAGAPVPTDDITVTVPGIERGHFSVFNNTEQLAYVSVSGQSAAAPSIAAGGVGHFLLAGGSVYLSNGSALAAASAPVERRLFFRASDLVPTFTGGCAALATVATAANQPDITSLDFDQTTSEHAQLDHIFEAAAHLGNVSFQFVWSHASGGTSFDVAWLAKAVLVGNDDALGVSFGTPVLVTDVGGTADDLYVTARSAYVKVASPADAELAVFDVFRDPGQDALDLDARLVGVYVYYWDNSPLDASWASVELLFGADGLDGTTAVDDESDAGHVATYAGNAQCDDAQARFGLRSLRVDGTGDFVTFADEADFELGSGAFCLEGHVMWNTDPAAFQALFGKYDNTGNQRSYSLNYDGAASDVLVLLLSTTGTDVITKLSYAFVPELLRWYHLAADFDGTTYRLFVDGALVHSAGTPVALFGGAVDFAIGAQPSGNFPLDGWFDEVRLTKAASRYTAPFAPPTAPFPRG